jgi:hypothetical protein
MVEMERALSMSFEGVSFGAGIEQLMIVVLSVSLEDDVARRCKGHDKVRKLRHPFTKEPNKVIGLAVPIRFDVLAKMDQTKLRKFVCDALLEKIAKPYLRIPKDFDYQRFSEYLSGAIASYSSCYLLG